MALPSEENLKNKNSLVHCYENFKYFIPIERQCTVPCTTIQNLGNKVLVYKEFYYL